MKRLAVLAAPFAACVLMLAACGSSDRQAVSRAQTSLKPSAAHHVGDSLITCGMTGPVKLIVTGAAYPDKPQAYKAYAGGPQNGTFLVISYRAQALKTPTTLGAPIDGAGFSWRGHHRVLTETDGNGANPPWVGRVPEASSQHQIQPSMSEDYTVTLDVPQKGGKLAYAAPCGQLAGTWALPDHNVGPAEGYVDRAVKELIGASGSTAATTSSALSTAATPTQEQSAPGPRTRSPAADSAPGCGQRAVAAGTFNPSCSEYQGYLDPGEAGGRAPNSGDLQTQFGCEQGYIPQSQCGGD